MFLSNFKLTEKLRGKYKKFSYNFPTPPPVSLLTSESHQVVLLIIDEPVLIPSQLTQFVRFTLPVVHSMGSICVMTYFWPITVSNKIVSLP